MVCFQSTNTSCETYRQETGSSRKLMQKTEAQLGVAPNRFPPFERLTLLRWALFPFISAASVFLWELKNPFFGYRDVNMFLKFPASSLAVFPTLTPTSSLGLSCACCRRPSFRLLSKFWQKKLPHKKGIFESPTMLL